MTTRIREPGGGRGRGPRALVRAWVEVLVRPRRFFRTGVAAGDQAPGITFAMAVVLVEEASRFALVPGALPAVAGGRAVSALVAVAVAVLLVVPVALHLAAAAATAALVPLAGDRDGISATVQVIAYATAPCALAGPAIAPLRVLAAAYGAGLLVLGLATVHGTGPLRAAVAGAVPAALVFGYGFRGFAAAATLLAEVKGI